MILQAVRLIFQTFKTWDANDYMMVYDITGTELIVGKIYGTQTGRENITVHGNGAFVMFKSNHGAETTGFKIEFQCYTLTANGMCPYKIMLGNYRLQVSNAGGTLYL